MLVLMRYQAQNLGKKLCSLGKVRVYQCFFFSIFGFGFGVEVGVGMYAMETSKVCILVWILQNCSFKNLLHIEYKYKGCEQFKCTSTYFRFVSLLYLFIRKKVLESNNEQAANTKIKLHSTSNNFFNALSNALSSAKL